MKKTLAAACLTGLVATVAYAGLFKDSVDLADLSQVPPEKLESLRDTEFEFFRAQVKLNAAKAAERRATGGLKAANQVLEAEDLDLKAAEAESKAAKANEDEERAMAAAVETTAAEKDLKTAKRLRKWKRQEQEARQAEVKMAKSAVDLAEAQRDLARVRLLKDEDVPAAKKYDAGELERNVSKRQKEYDSASRRFAEKSASVDELKAEWERVAKNLPIEDTP